jgi:hypothetical protein
VIHPNGGWWQSKAVAISHIASSMKAKQIPLGFILRPFTILQTKPIFQFGIAGQLERTAESIVF